MPLEPLTVIVGRNNAGKSTLVESLRLVALVAARHEHLVFQRAPDWLDLPRSTRGVVPSLRGLEIDFEAVFHQYGDPPAEIQAHFVSGAALSVFVGPDSAIFATIMDARGHIAASHSDAIRSRLPSVAAFPQVGPLVKTEAGLIPEYVRANVGSPTSYLRFRNELAIFPKEFRDFSRLAEASWPGLRIESLRVEGTYPDSTITLLIRDDNFVAEVGRMGHGLQMWLQMMWFVARSDGKITVILDEPNVYMHADLQRRLIRLVRSRYRQTVIATHSVEIMAEVEPENILVVDKDRRRSRFAPSLPAAQEIIEHIGGTHNLHLARLATARKCLLVEGKDVETLRYLQNTIRPHSQLPLDVVPNVALGGWGGFHHAVGIARLLRGTGEERLRIYCIFDRDYHSTAELDDRMARAREEGIELHIWRMKEIENYLLVPSAVHRIIMSSPQRSAAVAVGDVAAKIDSLVRSLETHTVELLASEIQRRNRGMELQSALRSARIATGELWKTEKGRLSLVSGKQVLARIMEWGKESFDVSISPRRILRELRLDEIPPELIAVISAIDAGDPIEWKAPW